MIPGAKELQQPDIDDQNRHFRTDHLQKDLAGRSTRGGAVTLSAQVVKFAVSTAATILLARLLAPQDYGLIGMVAILTSFLGMFQYMGLSTATIKWSELDHRQVSSLFWLNIGLSAAIMLVALAGAPVLAWFYKEPRLIGITAGYALTIFLTGLTIQHEAILMRQMRFTAVAIIEITAMTVGLCAAVVAAWYGAGYWALVINQMVLAVVAIIGLWTACKWRPGWPGRSKDIRSLISYGGNLTGFNVMNYLSHNLDNALIGKFWGAYQLGIYSRAYQLLLMPMAQINSPLVSRIFMLLGVAAMIQPVTRTVLWLFTTQGRTREMFKWGFISSAIGVISIVAGLPWGATGVAAAYAVTDLCVTTPLLFWYVGRRGPVRSADFYRTIAPAFCASVCSLAALLICRPWLEVLPSLITRLGIAFMMTAAVSLLMFSALPTGRLAMHSFKEMLLLLLKRDRESVA